MGMARNFESGMNLVERCCRELPSLSRGLSQSSAGRRALDDLIAAATRAHAALSWSPPVKDERRDTL
jgi:hypothetical protein